MAKKTKTKTSSRKSKIEIKVKKPKPVDVLLYNVSPDGVISSHRAKKLGTTCKLAKPLQWGRKKLFSVDNPASIGLCETLLEAIAFRRGCNSKNIQDAVIHLLGLRDIDRALDVIQYEEERKLFDELVPPPAAQAPAEPAANPTQPAAAGDTDDSPERSVPLPVGEAGEGVLPAAADGEQQRQGDGRTGEGPTANDPWGTDGSLSDAAHDDEESDEAGHDGAEVAFANTNGSAD